MKAKWTLAAALALALVPAPGPAWAQSPDVTEITFPSNGFAIRGLFFTSAIEPIATLLLLPPGDLDPTHVLDMGGLLPSHGVNVVTFAPRGNHGSEGVPSIAHFIDDIGAALQWLRGDGGKAFRVDAERIAIGGYSLGGGLAMAYAIRDSTVRGVVSIAGNDLGEFARRLQGSSAAVAGLRQSLTRRGIPDPDAFIREILDGEGAFGHTENAPRLAGRAILLIGGWDDATAPIETVVLPFYRSLKRQLESDVTIIAYQDGHAFLRSREEMASDIWAWLALRFPR
jgi:dienelactone hydrolase